MTDYSCAPCQKTFDSAEALEMHNQAKHAETATAPLLTSRQKKKMRNWVIAFVIIGFLIFGTTLLVKKSGSGNSDWTSLPDVAVPVGPIHWHPHLRIVIDGREQIIPKDIGITSTVHYPLHTHETDGVLHLENNNPTARTMILGYFFELWSKTFNKDCIFDYCTDKGTLKMLVNGKENTEYGNYFMQDRDEILIEYTSTAS